MPVPAERGLRISAALHGIAEVVGDIRLARKQAQRFLHERDSGGVVAALRMQQAEPMQRHRVTRGRLDEFTIQGIGVVHATGFVRDDGLL